MKQLFSHLTWGKSISSLILGLFLTGSVTTSVFAGYKALSGQIQSPPEVAKIQAATDSQNEPTEQENSEVQEKKDTNPSNGSPVPSSSIKGNSGTSPTLTTTPTKKLLLPTAAPIASPTQATTTNSNQCIITLFGKQYDVTQLRFTHSGGNIFTCNTDMSATYQSKHGTNMSRMQQYLVTNTTSPGSSSPIPTSNPSSLPSSSSQSFDDDDHVEFEKKEDQQKEDIRKQESEKEDHE